MVSPSVVPSHVRAVAKNDELSLRQFVLEKNVSPVRLPKQEHRGDGKDEKDIFKTLDSCGRVTSLFAQVSTLMDVASDS